ncbi:MAG TPA: DUF6036 family nucleotidyltransferase [Chthoniobacteraceae bacterium]|nr:DUF6036 family nucleotidyltransferase [Chthoniobacteraceae bacterium]
MAEMNNAQRIVAVLDRHLTTDIEIIVFGSAAMMLDPMGSDHLKARQTNDVDIIIPSQLELMIEANEDFWNAIEAANREMEPDGLYISHIFPEQEVTLTPEWQNHLMFLPIAGLERLKVWRPRMLDLIVSKMGRGDAMDLEDVRQMVRLEREVFGSRVTSAELMAAADRAIVPAVYREIFPKARDVIIQAVREME